MRPISFLLLVSCVVTSSLRAHAESAVHVQPDGRCAINDDIRPSLRVEWDPLTHTTTFDNNHVTVFVGPHDRVSIIYSEPLSNTSIAA